MTNTLKQFAKKSTQRLARYRDILNLLLKHGGTTLLRDLKLNEIGLDQSELTSSDIAGDPESLAADLEALGPTFIKLGQTLSMRPDLLPPPYQAALTKLQDTITPFPHEEVERIIEEQLNVRLSRAFAEFNTEPLAAASLGQVHTARLRDGRRVVVKIQRPDVRDTITADLDDLRTLAGLFERNTEIGKRLGLVGMLEQFRFALLQELDYEQEAQNLTTLATMLENYDDIVIPQPVNDFSTERVLTMTHIDGEPLSKLEGFRRLNLEADNLTASLCKAYLDQILVHGFVHADPHMGNVLLTKDQRLALLDLGMVAYVDPDMRTRLLKLLLAMAENRGEAVAEVCLAISTPLEGADLDKATRQTVDKITQYQHAPEGKREIGRMLLELTQIAVDNGIRPAAEISLLGKTLLYLDQIARQLSPEFNPDTVIRKHSAKILNQHLSGSVKPTRLMSSMLDAKILAEDFPKQLNKIVGILAENRFKVDVDAVNENVLMQNIEKVANRIAAGLVLAALIIGAALLMPIETTWTLFGYPALAIILFTIAVIGGFILVADALFFNRHKSPPT